MADTNLTVKVHLDFDLNGEPITRILEMPASIEDPYGTPGLTVHLHIDAAKLATIITPHILRDISARTRVQNDGKAL